MEGNGLMGWEIGYDHRWRRDIGYGVPAICDHPDCNEKIDRGLGSVCGGDPYGGEDGCGLFFCGEHLLYDFDEDDGVSQETIRDGSGEVIEQKRSWRGPFCERCLAHSSMSDEGPQPFTPKPDIEEWVQHKATDPSWAEWRAKQAVPNG